MTPRAVPRTAVVAIGGNALLRGGTHATVAEQVEAARRLASPVVALADTGWRVVVTHGNGPQVGFIKRRAELAAALAPELPAVGLDMCVADSQGGLGYILATAIAGRLRSLGRADDRVAALITHTVVDAHDEAFSHPTKPIGAFCPAARARELADLHNWTVAEEGERGWRRVVPSPRPRRVLETEAVRALSSAGFTVIAAGGGGIPLVETDDGGYRGVEAVIDKDLTSAHLAAELGAELLVITTGVERVAVDYGRPTQRYLDRLTHDEAERLLAQGQFPPGSMGPKIRAALDFLRGAPGRQVLITSPRQLGAALDGRGGTRLDSEPARTTEEPLNGTVTAGRPQ
ncbi:amino acid kinase [Streptomyces sp. CB01635]|uniref:carbamate kinase n=1 Tax=unclassified Streptomyces TaxID=2593676 RepID=UPI000C27220D|nr:carbamate kinase [Streptomyces sp. CB01635]PJN06243.1 amino acid kinase [Streptomyces sp. CB01635]